MVFTQKVMFLGIETRKKDDKIYYFLKVLDKSTNENLTLFVVEPSRFKEVKAYTDIDLKFSLDKRISKEGKTFYNLNLIEE